MEAFKPAVGTVFTYGYDDLGSVLGVSVDVREMKGALGSTVRGLVVKVSESEYRTEQSFVDADEIPELIKGFDALMQVKSNPTSFRNFEVRYTTKGELELTAFNSPSSGDAISFAVEAGRISKAQRIGLTLTEMQTLRALFQSAAEKLASLPAAR
jgi:hypothetical protein